MADHDAYFLALALAGILLIVYLVARQRGHQAHHGGIIYDAHKTELHVHVHV